MSAPVFDHNKVIVIFVLGGPGAGKSTQCALLVQDFQFCHLSAGALLRAERDRPNSEYGEIIRKCIEEGTLVPMEITIKLLENAMRSALAEGRGGEAWADGKGRFLIDGFPREMTQGAKFEETICPAAFTLFVYISEATALGRLANRGREDDDEETIKKRFRTYQNETLPVIKHYRGLSKLVQVDGSGSMEVVYTSNKYLIEGFFQGQRAFVIA